MIVSTHCTYVRSTLSTRRGEALLVVVVAFHHARACDLGFCVVQLVSDNLASCFLVPSESSKPSGRAFSSCCYCPCVVTDLHVAHYIGYHLNLSSSIYIAFGA